MKSIRCRVSALLAAIVAVVAIVKFTFVLLASLVGLVVVARRAARLPEARTVDQARLPLGARHLGALERDALDAGEHPTADETAS